MWEGYVVGVVWWFVRVRVGDSVQNIREHETWKNATGRILQLQSVVGLKGSMEKDAWMLERRKCDPSPGIMDGLRQSGPCQEATLVQLLPTKAPESLLATPQTSRLLRSLHLLAIKSPMASHSETLAHLRHFSNSTSHEMPLPTGDGMRRWRSWLESLSSPRGER